jgi:hypothetical protein
MEASMVNDFTVLAVLGGLGGELYLFACERA